jgi:LysR family glycine cleavage system transcriptional activator
MPLIIDEAGLVLDAAAAGGGVALARSVLAGPDLHSGRLVRLFDIEVPAIYSYWLVWNPVSEKQDAIARFRDWLTDELAAML